MQPVVTYPTPDIRLSMSAPALHCSLKIVET